MEKKKINLVHTQGDIKLTLERIDLKQNPVYKDKLEVYKHANTTFTFKSKTEFLGVTRTIIQHFSKDEISTIKTKLDANIYNQLIIDILQLKNNYILTTTHMGTFILKDNQKTFHKLTVDNGTSTFLYGGRALRRGWNDRAVVVNCEYRRMVVVEIRGDNKRGKLLKINLDLTTHEKVMHFQTFGVKNDWVVAVIDKGYVFLCRYSLDKLKNMFRRRQEIYPGFRATGEEGATIAVAEDHRTIMLHTCDKSCNPLEVIVYQLNCHILELKHKVNVKNCCNQYFYSFEYFKTFDNMIFFAGLEAYSSPNSFCVFCYDEDKGEITVMNDLAMKVVEGRACRVERLGQDLITCSENMEIHIFSLESLEGETKEELEKKKVNEIVEKEVI